MRLIILALFFSTSVFAGAHEREEFSTASLVCVYNRPGSFSLDGANTSCVAKASIEKDKVELEILQRQLAEMKSKDTVSVKFKSTQK